MVAVTLTRPEGQDMALWTGAKDIRLTGPSPARHRALRAWDLLPDPDLPGEKDSERKLVKWDY